MSRLRSGLGSVSVITKYHCNVDNSVLAVGSSVQVLIF